MDKKIQVIIEFDGLPDQPNCHQLAVALESEIEDAVINAMNETGIKSKDFTVHVPSF